LTVAQPAGCIKYIITRAILWRSKYDTRTGGGEGRDGQRGATHNRLGQYRRDRAAHPDHRHQQPTTQRARLGGARHSWSQGRNHHRDALAGWRWRLWNYCNVLRDDGLSYGAYVERLTW
jgi:hypothetical protein